MTLTLTTLAGFVISGLVTLLSTWLKGQADVGAAKREGAEQSTAAANKETLNATERMLAANAAPRSRNTAADSLRNGDF